MTSVLVADRQPGREAHRCGRDGHPACGGTTTRGWHLIGTRRAGKLLDEPCRGQGCYPTGVIDDTHSPAWPRTAALLTSLRERFTPERHPGWEDDDTLTRLRVSPPAAAWVGPKHAARPALRNLGHNR